MKILFFVLIIFLNNVTPQIFVEDSFENNFNSITKYLNEFKVKYPEASDLQMLDSLYFNSVRLTKDRNEALLLLALISLPYRKVPVSIPIFGLSYKIPLPSLDEESFKIKIKNTPGKFFFDSPYYGDKDKVTHFFGNAFLATSFGYFNLSKFMGIFIELFERGFIALGEFDIRDMMVNNLGNCYGYLLYSDKNIPPSSVLKLYSLYYFRFYK